MKCHGASAVTTPKRSSVRTAVRRPRGIARFAVRRSRPRRTSASSADVRRHNEWHKGVRGINFKLPQSICGLGVFYAFFNYPKLLERAKELSFERSKLPLKREGIEIIVFLGFALLYIVFKNYVAGHAILILPTILLCIGYVIYSIIKVPNLLKEFGIRLDNIIPASKLSALYLVSAASIILTLFFVKNPSPPQSNFYFLLFLYPIWGLSQQFLFQSFFHTRLLRLGLARWSILIVAIVYAMVHWPSITLVLICFLGGIISSYIFSKFPNILPLGIVHGILGAMIYYLLLQKDALKYFIDSLQ